MLKYKNNEELKEIKKENKVLIIDDSTFSNNTFKSMEFILKKHINNYDFFLYLVEKIKIC